MYRCTLPYSSICCTAVHSSTTHRQKLKTSNQRISTYVVSLIQIPEQSFKSTTSVMLVSSFSVSLSHSSFPFFLSLSLSISLSLSLFLSLSFSLVLSLNQSIYLSTYLPTYLSFLYLSFSLSYLFLSVSLTNTLLFFSLI